jgi:hypothetical protein
MASIFDNHRKDMLDHITVEIEFTGRLVGGQPKDPKLIQGWLGKGMGIDDADVLWDRTRQHLADMGIPIESGATDAEVMAAVEALGDELKTQGFKRENGNANGCPCIEGRHVKAMLKEAANVVWPSGTRKFGGYVSTSAKNSGKQVGGKAAKDYLAERVFVPEELIPVADKISGVELSIGHIKDWKADSGKRSTLGYYEYIERPTTAFTMLAHKDVLSPDDWASLLVQCEIGGLGAMRSQGYGQFEIHRFDFNASDEVTPAVRAA